MLKDLRKGAGKGNASEIPVHEMASDQIKESKEVAQQMKSKWFFPFIHSTYPLSRTVKEKKLNESEKFLNLRGDGGTIIFLNQKAREQEQKRGIKEKMRRNKK